MGRWRQREEQAGQAGTDVEGSLAPHLHPPEHPHILHPHTHQFIHLPMAKLLSPHHPPSTTPRSRAAPAPRRPETASDHVSKEEESDKNHSGDEDEDDNEGDEDDEVSPFTGLVAKLAASKWRLDAVKLRTTFPKSALHSRDFMRQLVAWAEHGEYTFDLMLQAIDETRRNIHQSSDPRRRVPKEDQWRPQYFRHTLERLHAQGKELRVPHRVQKAQQPPPSSPQAQLPVLPSARSGQKRSHSMTQKSDANGHVDDLLRKREHKYDGEQTTDTVSSAPAISVSHKTSPTTISPSNKTSPAAMALSDQSSSMSTHTLPGPLRMIDPPHAGAAFSVQPAPLPSVPATHTVSSTESLQPVPRLPPSSIERCLAIFAPKDWCVITVPLRSGAPIRLKDHQRQVVLPICRHGNYWIVVFLNLNTAEAQILDSLPGDDTVPTDVLDLLKGFTAKLSDAKWTFQRVPCTRQTNEYNCALHVLVTAFFRMSNIDPPHAIDARFWKGFFRHAYETYSGRASSISPLQPENYEELPIDIESIKSWTDDKLSKKKKLLKARVQSFFTESDQAKKNIIKYETIGKLQQQYKRGVVDQKKAAEDGIRNVQRLIALHQRYVNSHLSDKKKAEDAVDRDWIAQQAASLQEGLNES